MTIDALAAPASDSETADALAVLTIDLGALTDNWRQLAARSAPSECAAAVKADAYGLGIDAVVPALAGAGCRTFFTAHVSEARRTRSVLRESGMQGRIFVLNGFHPQAAPLSDYVEFDLAPVIGSMDELAAWEQALRSAPEQDRLHCADPCRHRHEPTRFPGRGGAPPAAAKIERRPGSPGDEPPRFVRSAGRGDQCAADRGLRARTRARASPVSGLVGEFLRHFPAAAPRFRPRPARLCALWRKSHAGAAQPHAPGGFA